MALLFCDGFDHYDTAHIFEKWDSNLNGGNPMITTGGRNTSQTYNNCMTMNGTQLGKAVGNAPTLIVGFALNPGLLSGNNQIVDFNDLIVPQTRIVSTASGQIQVTDGNGTVLGITPSPCITSNTFNYVEISITFSTTGTGTCAINVNGASVLSLTNIANAITTNAYANLVVIYGGNSTLFDDLYICDNTGTYNNTFLGDVRIALALPSAVGRLSQWTRTGGTSSGNYTAVDEVPPNDDTSYVSSSTVAQIDAYGISSIGTVSAIVAVQLVASARKTDAASRSVGLGFGNTTTDNFDAGHSISSSYVMYRRTMDSNPITSAAWAAGDLASAQIALKVIS